jgi:gamma-glutamyl hydrolase
VDTATGNNDFVYPGWITRIPENGGELVLVQPEWSADRIIEVLEQTDGVLFQGGSGSRIPDTLIDAQTLIVDWVMKANDGGDYYPLLGVCLGFQRLCRVLNNNENCITSGWAAHNLNLPLEFTDHAADSVQFANAPTSIMDDLQNATTWNIHSWSIADSGWPDFMDDIAIRTAYSYDSRGDKFIANYELTNYPIYATQWHPEITSAGCAGCENVSAWFFDWFAGIMTKSDHTRA